MPHEVAIIGAGVSGLTCGVVFAERGYRAKIFAAETGQHTTSAAAAAIWFPYDAEPAEKVIAWALESYEFFRELSRDSRGGVSMIELRTFSRVGEIEIPSWAHSLGARDLPVAAGLRPAPRRAQCGGYNGDEIPEAFASGFVMTVPLIDTTIYLDYLANRFLTAGGEIHGDIRFHELEDVEPQFDRVINCAGIGAGTLASDSELEPHRGQVAIVAKLDLPHAVVSDDAPLMYVIPRSNDCVLGGTNELSDNRVVDPSATARIVTECCRVLKIDPPKLVAERVGLRPFRRTGVRLEPDRMRDGRSVIHNYGHGGSGFTLSWGCAMKVLEIARLPRTINP